MIEKIEKYIKDTLHQECPLYSVDTKNIPIGVLSLYDIYKGCISGVEVFFAISKTQNTPAGYQKAQAILHNALRGIVIIVIGSLSPAHTHRMIEKGIDFIVPNQRMYLPSLFLNLGGRQVNVKADGLIPPLSQLILLYHLQKDSLDGKVATDIADLLGSSYLTATRAFKWIGDNLFPLMKDGRKLYLSLPDYGETLKKAKPYLRTPVIKTIRTEDDLSGMDGVACGEYALGQISMLESHGICKAVNKGAVPTVTEDANAYNCIELWMYPPEILSSGGICDRISLILSLGGNEDERVQAELDKIKESVQW